LFGSECVDLKSNKKQVRHWGNMYQIKVITRDFVREQRKNRVILRILSVTAYMPCVGAYRLQPPTDFSFPS
jgi:hypothetical protein